MALVLSAITASRPSSPRALSRSTSVGRPMTGSLSNFQSPVCNSVPTWVWIASPQASGIEWLTGTNSTPNGPALARPPWLILVTFASSSKPTSSNLRSITALAKGVATIGQRNRCHKCGIAPIWSSCAWVIMIPTTLLGLSKSSSMSGTMTSSPGVDWSAKLTPISVTNQ